jgi:hypothetical protein
VNERAVWMAALSSRFDLWNEAAIQHRNERREIVGDLDASDRARHTASRRSSTRIRAVV